MSEHHSSQFIPGTKCSPFDCACGSCGMAVAYAGGPELTHAQVRAESGVSCAPGVDTVSGGLRIDDVKRVAAAHGVTIDYGTRPDGTHTSWPRDTLRQRLMAGDGAILLGDCQDAPVNPTTGVVLHSAFVHDLRPDGRTHWHDPRLPASYWITLADVIRYWESFNGSVRYAGFVAPGQAGAPPDTGTEDDMSRAFDVTDDRAGALHHIQPAATFIDPFTGESHKLEPGDPATGRRGFACSVQWRDTGVGGWLIAPLGVVEDNGLQDHEYALPPGVDAAYDEGLDAATNAAAAVPRRTR